MGRRSHSSADSTGELRALFARWQEGGDVRAREELLERFLPLARKLVGRYARTSEPRDDLVQVASIGLLQAIDRYDPDRGAAFSSFAVPTILGELKRHFRDHCWSMHVPRPEQELALRVGRAESSLATRLGRSPTAQELGDELSLSVEEVCEGLGAAASYRALSLNAPMNDDEGEPSELGATVGAPEEGYELVEVTAALGSVMQKLSHEERTLIDLRFGEELSQREIGTRIGVSQMQVSRLLRRAQRHLKEVAAAEAPDIELRFDSARIGGPNTTAAV